MFQASLLEIANIFDVCIHQDVKISGISVSSQNCQSGHLFFALPGERTDGHYYLEDACQRGAVAAVVKRGFTTDLPLILIPVEDVLQALQTLAKSILKRTQARVIAITGSVGKTTTKDFISCLLAEKFRVFASPGNQNSQVGLCLSVLNAPKEVDYLVLEMGMSSSGQIRRLIEIAPPDIAILTAVEWAHAQNFASLEEIALAKAEIFESSYTQVGLINHEIHQIEKVKATGTCFKKTFSMVSENGDYWLEAVGEVAKIKNVEGEILTFSLPKLPGLHNRQNLLAAVCCALQCGLSVIEIQNGIEKLKLPERRLEIVQKQGVTFYNDSYNACEASVKAALFTLKELEIKNKKIAVLGDMLELGHISQQTHERIGQIALDCVDEIYCYGQEMQHLHRIWQQKGRLSFWFEKQEELSLALKQTLSFGDIVLIKGSRGMQMWKVLEQISQVEAVYV